MTLPHKIPHVSIEDVRAATNRIADHVHHTPVATSATLDRELTASVFFKMESMQKVGAFKARGALNAVFQLDDEAAANGVVTHSSGNHGQALAYAAAKRGLHCTVVVPDDAPAVKVDAMRGYGADIVLCPHSERVATMERVRAETGATLIHPFNNTAVIAGQGTAALELLEDVPDLDVVVAPVGGGGLMSGTTVTVRALSAGTRLIGAEPAQVDDAARSLATGVIQPATGLPTLGDGLRTALENLTFEILTAGGVEIVTVEETAIAEAARFHLYRMKYLVEPSGAVGLAALRKIVSELAGKRIGVIVSGGNTDLAWLRA
ncbi:MAG: threonine/serine dehydratase [bacterium]|nr:threonine/serine dehydratase [bacterium]